MVGAKRERRSYWNKVSGAPCCRSETIMANDAKLGLVVGVAIVLVIALVFFRPDAHAARTDQSQTSAVKDAPVRAQFDMARN